MTAERALSVLTAVVFTFTIFCPSAKADSFTFQTIPAAGDVYGPAGSTVGWGYSITNDSLTNWLVTADFNASPFLNGTPNSLFDFPILSPGEVLVVPFDVVNGFGLYQLTWDVNAPAGFTDTGVFDVTAEWFSGDPFVDGIDLGSAGDQPANFSATVTASNVPEPSTLALLLSGLGTLAVFRRSTSNRI